ncbi:IS5 family transposase [Fluviibacterium sp. S390]|uniref:IS5 family transposase n=1 Tax=Fluviibacterium sp. S390 TaxID=3415139 RepID=UPI003C7CEBD7
MTDEEWRFFEHFILAARAPNGRKPTNHRRVLDGIFWIARTGAPWRDLPEDFGKWSSVYRQFRRWTLMGLWEEILDALNQSGAVPDALQMVDSTVIRAHHQAAGAKGGLRDRVLGAQEVGSRPRSTSASTRQAEPPRVYRRVKLSKGEPHDREESFPELHG